MTWRKTGVEFDDQCAEVDLSDPAYRTHMEAIGYLYKTEQSSCRFNKTAVRRFATSKEAHEAIKELINHGFWLDRQTHYEVVHHADVIVDSLEAQANKRDRDRAAQQRAREKKAASEKGTAPVNVIGGVSADTRQTDRQTGKHLDGGSSSTCHHGIPNGTLVEPWSQTGDLVCARCTSERKSA